MPPIPAQTKVQWVSIAGEHNSLFGYYRCLSVDYLPKIPTERVTNPFRGAKAPVWAYDEFYYMMFAPRVTPRYDDELFRSLNRNAIEIIRTPRGYQLKPDTTKQWLAVERLLIEFTSIMESTSGYLFPLGTKQPFYPSTQLYANLHDSEAKAKHAAHSALLTFTVVLTYLSYMACMMQLADNRHVRVPGNRMSFQDRFRIGARNINEATVEIFLLSWVWNLTLPRQGCFVNVLMTDGADSNCTWVKELKYQIALQDKLPFWLYYGSQPTPKERMSKWHAILRNLYSSDIERETELEGSLENGEGHDFNGVIGVASRPKLSINCARSLVAAERVSGTPAQRD